MVYMQVRQNRLPNVLKVSCNPSSRKGWGIFSCCIQKQEQEKPHNRLGHGVEGCS